MKRQFTLAEKLLLILNISDGVIGGWFSVWYTKIFLNLLDYKYVSAQNILSALLGVLLMLLVIKMFEEPSFRVIFYSSILSYLSLFALYLSPGMFILVNTICSILMGALVTALRNSIQAKNIANDRRASYDNYESVLSRIGLIIGGIFAFMTILPTIQYQIIWICSYVIFDLDLIIIYFLVKYNVLKY